VTNRPNHEEILSIYSKPLLSIDDPALHPTLEEIVHHLLHTVGIGLDGTGIVAVRCGRLGTVVGTKAGGIRWFPAFFGGDEEKRVVDVTGGESPRTSVNYILMAGSW
jgi:hypothetical protein